MEKNKKMNGGEKHSFEYTWDCLKRLLKLIPD